MTSVLDSRERRREHGGSRAWGSRAEAAAAFTALLLLLPFESAAQGPAYLVKDINSNPSQVGTEPEEFVGLAGTAFFVAYDTDHGRELWKSDGTAAGTQLVKDILPGLEGSGAGNLLAFNGALYFRADDGVNGAELWTSDGTAAGTHMVKDIFAGTRGSYPVQLTIFDSALYFVAASGDPNDRELWRSDGTAAGTELVKDIRPGIFSSYPSFLTAIGSTLFFSADDGSNGTELWMSDGTEAGTVMVTDLTADAGSSSPRYLANVDGVLYFNADDLVHGKELWKSDGTAVGTTMVKDILPGSRFDSSDPKELTSSNGLLFFTAEDGLAGRELWKSDGTEAGTTMVKDIQAGISTYGPEEITPFGSGVVFRANDGTNGLELWTSDGTTGGTVMVKNIWFSSIGSNPKDLVIIGSTLYFFASGAIPGTWYGRELWKSDGTDGGTTMVKDINPGNADADYDGWSIPTPRIGKAGGKLFFQAQDGTHGRELWVSDGTGAGTLRLSDLTGVSAPSSPYGLVDVDGTLFFRATNGVDGDELWSSDGTEIGTALVKNIYPGPTGSTVLQLTDVNGTLFFAAEDGTNGHELWKSDGTSAGTVLVKDIRSGADGSFPSELAAFGGMVFFTATDGSTGFELWKSDGTSGGTVLVRDLWSGTASSSPQNLVAVNDLLFFTATTSQGAELWKSDGTLAGTGIVRDIRSGYTSSNPSNLTAAGGLLFFTADDGSHGVELWTSDGSEAGTLMVKDIRPDSLGSSPASLTLVGTTLYFSANDGTYGNELWRSDGTVNGTVMVKDIYPGYSGSGPGELANVNGTLYFVASDPTSGTALWRSDGSESGTVMVKDIDPTSSYTSLGSIIPATPAGGMLLSADDRIHGSELWRSDGTAEGTVLVHDILEGSLGSFPGALLASGSHVFFVPYDPIHGDELWAVSPSDVFPRGFVQFSDVQYSVGEAAGTATISVTHSGGTVGTVSVTYKTGDISAIAGSDYTAVSDVLTWNDGETGTKTFEIPILDDNISEATESILLSLDDATGGVAIGNRINAVLQVTDADALPGLSIEDAGVPESLYGTMLELTVSLSSVSGQDVSVDYTTAGDTATPDTDYLTASGTLTITAGDSTGIISIPILGDQDIEPDETFFVELSNPVHANLTDGQGIGTIINDDFPPPTVSLGEPLGGTEGEDIVLTAVASSPNGAVVRYDWDFGDGTYGLDAGSSVTHVYSDGDYTVIVYVTDQVGAQNFDSAMLSVADSGPDVDFVANVQYQPIPYTVRFTDATTAYDGLSSWTWIFGDGSPVSTEQDPIHEYAAPGSYSVSLVVTDGDGSSGSVTKQVDISDLSDVLFTDGFESGDTSAWSSSPALLLLRPVALENSTGDYWATLRLARRIVPRERLYGQPILVGLDSKGRPLFSLDLRRGGAELQLRARAMRDDGSWQTSGWTSLGPWAEWIDLEWNRALTGLASGHLRVTIEGESRIQLDGIQNALADLSVLSVACDRRGRPIVQW